MKTSIQYFLTDAVEGPGVAYWAEAKDVQRDEHGYVTSFKVRDGGYESDRVSKNWKTVNEKSVKKAVADILSGEMEVRRDLAAQFIGKEWEYDSDGVDCVIQTICFGELIFG